MRSYDFKSLSDKDFEILMTDLLSAEFRVRFERFKPGRDSGVDGRYFRSRRKEVILQCKHWARSSVNALLANLRAKERKKIDRLKPVRYLLATSLELSRKNKDEITQIFAPYIKSASDVYGNEDINDLLGRHEEIERKHYKLWLASTVVLDRLINAAILGRSEFALIDIRDKAKLYVVTKNHNLAEQKLEKGGVILITGEPGIGKTTLAEQLCLSIVLKGFQLCVIADSIEEAEAMYRPAELQLFYFDDFLGRNYLSALERHEDSHIVGFIKRVAKDKTKRFILTSRTTVLNQGKRLTELFRIEKIERNEFEIRVDSLETIDRARILYNHIWFSELPTQFIEQILAKRRYREIINHRNFNPRLISFITDWVRLSDISANSYWQHIERMLNNPADVWEHAYDSQLDDYGRALLLLVVYHGNGIEERELRDAYATFLQEPLAQGYTGISDFDRNIKALVGSVLNRKMDDSESATYSLFNPSVADYVLKRTSPNAGLIESLFVSFGTEGALLTLNGLLSNGIISTENVQRAIIRLAQEHLQEAASYPLAYKARLVDLIVRYSAFDDRAVTAATTFLSGLHEIEAGFPRWNCLANGFRFCLAKNILSPEIAWQIVKQIDDATFLDAPDLSSLAELRHELNGDLGVEFEERLRDVIREYWAYTIKTELEERDILGEFYSHDDLPEAERIARETIQEILGEYGLTFSNEDVKKILRNCKIPDIIEDNIERSIPDGDDDGPRYSVPETDEIDDLFNVDMPPRPTK